MKKKIDKVVGRHENGNNFLDEDTMALVNTSSFNNCSRFTDLSVGSRQFSEVSRDDSSTFRVNSQGKSLISISDNEGRNFPGVRFEELQITDSSVILKIDLGDLISLLKLNDKNEMSDEVVTRLIDFCNLKEWLWDDFS